MNPIIRWIIRHSYFVVTVCLFLSIVSGYYAVQLYQNLRTSMEELLPHTARSVIDSNEVIDRLESTENLAVLVFSNQPEQSKRFVTDLAAKIEALPKGIASRVEYRIDRELDFFRKRRSLFLSLEDLRRVKDYVQGRIAYETELYNPLNIFRTTDLPEPVLNIRALEGKYSSRISSYTKFKDGYYANRDKTIRVMIVYLYGGAIGIEGAKKLRKAVDRLIAELDPASYDPEMEIRFTGGAQNVIEEHRSLIADLEFSIIVVMLLVTVALIIFYRSFLAPMILIVSLLMGTLWTFAVSYFVVGYLNANSAFLGAIVIGNGINFGLIQLARYVEERRKSRGHYRALNSAMTKTLTATWVAALAAGLAYGSLYLTEFRGFKQFGVIGLIGMVLCWLSAFTSLPAMLSIADRWFSLRPRGNQMPTPYFAHFVAESIRRFPRLVWGGSLALLAASVFLILNFEGQLIETDTTKLRDKTSMERGSGYLSKYLDEIFERYMSPVVILPKQEGDAEKVATEVERYRDRDGDLSAISSVYTLKSFVPDRQKEKIAVLREIQDLLVPEILRRLTPEDRRLVREFLTPESFQTFEVEDLPELVLDRFREKDGTVGKIVLVEPVLDKEKLADGDNQVRFIQQLRSAADEVQLGTPVAGQLPVTADMYLAVRRDGPRATVFALISVVILVMVLFRNRRTILLVLTSLGLGVFWLVGILLGWDLKINFLNFIALPITFGIGVDYAVNIFQRYRLEGRGKILKVIRGTGGAVTLASLTTIIGYGSLHLAGNQAFVSFGKLSVLGELTCLIAALFSVPAYIYFQDLKVDEREKEINWVVEKEKNKKKTAFARAKGIFFFSLPFFLTYLVCALQKFFSITFQGLPQVLGIYPLDKSLFGIPTQTGVLSLNEWVQAFRSENWDFAASVFYFGSPLYFIAFAAALTFWVSRRGTSRFPALYIQAKSGLVVWSFFLVSLICYSMYYFFPSAVPWYIAKYGLGEIQLDAAFSSIAAMKDSDFLGSLSRFALLFGEHRSPFSAFPDLKVAYAMMVVYFAFRFEVLRTLSLIGLLCVSVASVYLNLHYVIDVIGGMAAGFIGAWIIDLGSDFWERRGRKKFQAKRIEDRRLLRAQRRSQVASNRDAVPPV